MQSAHLYIRVSTDEQAIKGYSQRSQLDRLTRYCITHDITVLETILEDHSAKTFDRPAWSNMMCDLRHRKATRPNLILFTKWDRFSRNIGDAYYMISQLTKLGITIQAIDQELDLSIPENKIILAVYIATSEAENERRSLNVRQSIHEAKQEGRWTAHIPLGYGYKIAMDGKRYLCIHEPEANYILMAFQLAAENQQTVKSVYKYIISLGLKCSESNFRRILRSPTYYGQVIVPAFEQEAAFMVKGFHPPIVDEELFKDVQKVLNERKPASRNDPRKNDEQLFLRGFFQCPSCSRRLTGSASRGKKGKRYYYYHCISSCGYRIRADEINTLFVEMLHEFHPDEDYLNLYRDIFKQVRSDLFKQNLNAGKTITTAMDRLIERIIKAKELLSKGEIEDDDYLLIKNDCEHKIHELGNDFHQIDLIRKKENNCLNKAVLKFSDPGNTFNTMTLVPQREFLKAIVRDNAIMCTNWKPDQVFNKSVGLIWNIRTSETSVEILNPISITRLPYNNLNKATARVMTLESEKGIVVKRSLAMEVVNFMALFAKINSK